MIGKAFIKQFTILLISCGLFACAGSSEQPDGQIAERPAGRSDCISQGSVRDYRVLDDANLIVTAAGRRKYHIVLHHRAMSLRSNMSIGFHSSSGRICSNFSEVIVNGGFGPEKIRIASVRMLTPEDEEELLVRFGKKKPDYERPRQEEEVDSAEVEELD